MTKMTKYVCKRKDCPAMQCKCEMNPPHKPQMCLCYDDRCADWRLDVEFQKIPLPDWVKPGAWTYATSTGCYNKIVTVSNGLAVTEYDGTYYPEDFEDRLIIEARNRALDGIELRKFAGQIIVIANEAVQCGDYIYNGLMDFIEVGNNMYDADNLFDLDPNRYGVKEHLNADGEWVQ